jgi:hypothetical protein
MCLLCTRFRSFRVNLKVEKAFTSRKIHELAHNIQDLKTSFQWSIQLLLILVIAIPVGLRLFSASPIYAILKNIWQGVSEEISEEIAERKAAIKERRESEIKGGEKRRKESVRRSTIGGLVNEIKHTVSESNLKELAGVQDDVPEIDKDKTQEVPES